MKNIARVKTLDYLRGFFTIYIIIHHLNLYNYHKFLFFITGQGQFVVVMFLVLSGISQELSFNQFSDGSFQRFFFKKLKRIYPLFLASILLSYILESIHLGSWYFNEWKTLTGYLFNLQDLSNRYEGIWFDTLFGNTVLWYISYIWWSYMFFFFTKRKIKNENQLLFATTISILGIVSFHIYPNTVSHIISYFLIFWSGVEIAKSYQIKKMVTFKYLKPTLYALLLLVIIELIPVLFYNKDFNISYYPIIELRHYAYTLLGISLGIQWINSGKIGLKFLKKFDSISSISYGLFLFHYPFMVTHNPFHFYSIWINYLCAFISALFLSYVFTFFFKKLSEISKIIISN